VRAASTFVLLAATWVLLSGHFTAWHLGAGLASCVLVTVVSARLDLLGQARLPLRPLRLVFSHAPWLSWQVAKANLDVAWRVWHPRLPIQPQVVRLRDELRTDAGRALHANSITLTPGTVTVAIENGEIVVHALTDRSAAALREGDMQRRLQRIEAES